MGVLSEGNVRVSLPPGTTEEEVGRFLAVLPGVVAEVRAGLGVTAAGTEATMPGTAAEPDGAAESVSTEGAAMLTRLQHTEYVVISDDRRDRHNATAQRLTQQVDISGDVLMLQGEGAAGTPEP